MSDFALLTKEELIHLLSLKRENEHVTPAAKTRKKAEQTEIKKQEMLDRLTIMRETVANNRLAKKEETKDIKEKPANEPNLFEKMYASKLEKMEEMLISLNDSAKEAAEVKREKKERIQREKEEKIAADNIKKEQAERVKRIQEEQLEMARTQQYKSQQPVHQQSPQTPLAPTKPLPPPNPMAKFQRPKPQLW